MCINFSKNNFLACFFSVVSSVTLFASKRPKIKPQNPVVWQAKVIKSYPHNIESFTQGLFVLNGDLYESQGLYGVSAFSRINIKSGSVIKKINFVNNFFAEGATFVNGLYYILSWKSKHGYILQENKSSFKIKRRFPYAGEGWGLASDPATKQLILSDGSSIIRFLDTKTFKEKRKINIRLKGHKILRINELEFFKQRLWANVWSSAMIVGIDVVSGAVTDLVHIDVKGLFSAKEYSEIIKSPDNVLNGIAYDRNTGKIYITGKRWPKLFEVEFIKKEHK